MSMYHIVYMPEVHDRSRAIKGNGNHKGSPAGHRNGIVSSGNGCLKHKCDDCDNCPISDCDYDYAEERMIKSRMEAKR